MRINWRTAVPALAIAAALVLGAAKCQALPTSSGHQHAVTAGGGLVIYRGLNPPLRGQGMWARGKDGRWFFTRFLMAATAAGAAGYLGAAAGKAHTGGPGTDNPCHGRRGGYRIAEWPNRLGKRVFMNCFHFSRILGRGQSVSNFYKCITRVLMRGVSINGDVWRLPLRSGTATVHSAEQADGSFKITSASPGDGGWGSCAAGT